MFQQLSQYGKFVSHNRAHNFDAHYVLTIKFSNLGCAGSKLSRQAVNYQYTFTQVSSNTIINALWSSATMILACDLTVTWTPSSKANHLCWYANLTCTSFDVSWFFNCNAAAIRHTWLLLVFNNSFARATKNCGYKNQIKITLSGYSLCEYFQIM